MTTFEEFQASATTVPVSLRNNLDRIHFLRSGLQVEAGKISRVLGEGSSTGHFSLTHEQTSELRQRLGELLYYIAMACGELRIPLQDVANSSLERLQERLSGLDPDQR